MEPARQWAWSSTLDFSAYSTMLLENDWKRGSYRVGASIYVYIHTHRNIYIYIYIYVHIYYKFSFSTQSYGGRSFKEFKGLNNFKTCNSKKTLTYLETAYKVAKAYPERSRGQLGISGEAS